MRGETFLQHAKGTFATKGTLFHAGYPGFVLPHQWVKPAQKHIEF